MRLLISLAVLFSFVLQITHCSRILGVFPSPGYSQFILAESLMKELANRGHHVTVISPYSPKKSVKNYANIDISSMLKDFNVLGDLFELHNNNEMLNIFFTLSQLGLSMTEYLLAHQNVQTLIHSNTTFDAVIVEQFLNEAHMAFANHFKAPLITFSSTGASEWTNHYVGNPQPPSYIPNSFSGYSCEMNLFQRIRNLGLYLFEILYRYVIILPAQDTFMKKYFPNPYDINSVVYNTTIVLLNSHPSVTEPVPLVSNMVEIGGFHIGPEEIPLDVQKFLDDSKDGAVYFSMGSNLRSKDMKDETKQFILEVFAGLNQSVLWKFEDENLPRTNNVHIQKWLPQRGVLGHPNVKLFISHCGLISTIEAVYFGVPLLCIPVYGDQKMNAAVAARKGYGIHLPFGELSKYSLTNSINRILENTSFRTEAKKRSRWMRDRPLQPMDEAIYWIEYVIRYREAAHFRSQAVNLSWYQYLYLDALTILAAIILVLRLIIVYTRKIFLKRKELPFKKIQRSKKKHQ